MRCPDENVLAGYVDNVLSRERRAAVESHIDGCEPCRTIVSDLARLDHAGDQTVNAKAPGRPSAQTIEAWAIGGRAVHVVPGTLIGEYEVIGPIGAGGMGAVFAAIHPRIGKRAAIKVLQRQLAGDPSALVRFENEARAVNAIGHPNIVDIFAFGELPDGNPYFVMEQVEGVSLQSWLVQRGPISLEVAMPLLRQLFDALAAAHERGIIHRDLKPANIMIGGSESAPRLKVLDFGLAKILRFEDHGDELTNPGVAMGTPHFMSPEQYLGDAIDHRTDIYALGVVVYHMLCGCYPFVGNTPSAVGIQHLSAELTLPSSIMPQLPASIDHALVKALAKDPAARYASVRELEIALEQCLVASSPAPTVAIQQPARRSRSWMWALAAVATAATVTAVWIAADPSASGEPLRSPQPVTSVPADSTLPSVAVEPRIEESAPDAGQHDASKRAAKPAKPAPSPVSGRKTSTAVTPKQGSAGSGATTKPRCNPYRSLEGC